MSKNRMFNDSNEESYSILTSFPKFELSYETIIHKKVYDSDILLAIPQGTKYFIWFTVYKSKNTCFLLEISNENAKNIVNIKQCSIHFNESLSKNTILYGTLFIHNKINYFTIENIYYYKGTNITNKNYLNKLQTIKNILKNEISQDKYDDFNELFILGLPLIYKKFVDLLKNIVLLPYPIKFIKFINFKNNKQYNLNYFKPNKFKDLSNNFIKKQLTNDVFKITPDIQNDIYNLFCYKNNTEDFFDIAFIPDYQTSVMMNKLFRNIKENDNLDNLEESDDEEEFENEKEDKFVYLDKSFKMKCKYNHKFKRWVPISLANDRDEITSYNMLLNL